MLGVAPDAPLPVIRDAYRRAARAHHPDRHGDGAAARMAEINHAWQVLKDPASRQRYDLSLRTPTGSAAGGSAAGRSASSSAASAADLRVPEYVEPARFPWRFMFVLFLLGLAFVVASYATASEPAKPTVDHILQPGDCVAILPNGDASERLCSEPHIGVVDRLVPFGSTCEAPAEPHRDEQGMGTVCVLIG